MLAMAYLISTDFNVLRFLQIDVLLIDWLIGRLNPLIRLTAFEGIAFERVIKGWPVGWI